MFRQTGSYAIFLAGGRLLLGSAIPTLVGSERNSPLPDWGSGGGGPAGVASGCVTCGSADSLWGRGDRARHLASRPAHRQPGELVEHLPVPVWGGYSRRARRVPKPRHCGCWRPSAKSHTKRPQCERWADSEPREPAQRLSLSIQRRHPTGAWWVRRGRHAHDP